MKGSGDVRFRYYHTSALGNRAPCTYYLVTGDNNEFTGGVELFQSSVCADFKNEAAMGGPAEKFREDRLRFTSNACLRCSSSYVMSDPSRGIFMGTGTAANEQDGGTVEVLEGQTLTISNLISGASSLRKTGAGTLALCCDTNAFTGVVRHKEGVLAIRAADAVAKASLQQAGENAVWQVDAPEGMTLKGIDAIVANGEGNRSILIRPGAFVAAGKDSMIRANLVRFLGATAADAEAALGCLCLDDSALGNSWKTEISTQAVEGALLVKVTALRSGTIIVVR